MSTVRWRAGLRGAVAALALLASAAAGAQAQTKPFGDRPIQILVGFPAGGIFDSVNRILATQLQRELGVNIVPVPTPGAGGAIAMQKVVRGTPDGHTLMLLPTATLLSRPVLMGLNVDYRDFEPIASVAINFTMIAVKLDHRWKSIGDLVKDVKANPGKYTYALPSIGGNPHFAMELMSRAAGLKLVPVPYQGSPQAIVAAMGGEADFVVTDNVHPGIRPLATLSAKRSPFQPDVPTLRESGFDVELFSRFMLVAPKGTPAHLLKVLEAAVGNVVKDSEVRRLIERQGLEPVFESSAALRKIWPEQAKMYLNLIEDLGLAHHQKGKGRP